MTKKIILFVLIINISYFAFSQKILDQLTVKTASNIVNAIEKLPDSSKVTMTFFACDDDDEVKNNATTRLGIKFTKYLAKEIRIEIQKRKLSHRLLFPEEIDDKLYEKMKAGFKKPDDISSGDFWANFLENQKADFYISGKYRIDGDYEKINIVGTQIFPNNLGDYPKSQVIPVEKNVSKKIRDEQDKKYLKNLDEPLLELNSAYEELVNWTGNGLDFTLEHLDADGNKLTGYNLIIGKDYNISINLQRSAYVYAFFFDPTDTKKPYMYMLYPYDTNMDNFLSEGSHSLPPGYTYTPEPPGNDEQVYFQIFVSEVKIPIRFTYEEDENGYITAIFYEADCEDFLNKINKMDKTKISTKQLTFTRSLE